MSVKLFTMRDTGLSLRLLSHSFFCLLFLLPLIKFKQTQLLHIYFSVEFFPLVITSNHDALKIAANYILSKLKADLKMKPRSSERIFICTCWVSDSPAQRRNKSAFSTLGEVCNSLPNFLRF